MVRLQDQADANKQVVFVKKDGQFSLAVHGDPILRGSWTDTTGSLALLVDGQPHVSLDLNFADRRSGFARGTGQITFADEPLVLQLDSFRVTHTPTGSAWALELMGMVLYDAVERGTVVWNVSQQETAPLTINPPAASDPMTELVSEFARLFAS